MTFSKFKAKDSEVKGRGKDDVGEFKIKGKLYSDGGVSFKKEY